MSFDDNYLTENPYFIETPLDAYLDFEAPTDLPDPQPDVEDTEALSVQRTVQHGAGWLQEKPRTTLAILTTLFPGSVMRMKNLPEIGQFIGGFLFDAGYTPEGDEEYNPTWCWLEGAALPIRTTERKAIPCAEPMSPEEFNRQWEQIRGG